jgi:hypothetical protein
MTLNSEIHRFVFAVPERHAATSEVPEEIDTEALLEVNVIFTTDKRACAALKVAGALALNLNAHLNLVAVKEVPLAFPIDRPPVDIPFTQRRLYELAGQGVQGPLDTTVRLYYCRNKLQGLLQALKPKSLVVIGGQKRLWPTREDRLAKILRAKGHQVIFATDK